MSELAGDPRIRNLLTVGLVTVAHVVVLGLAITAKISIPLNPKVSALEVEIVEIEPSPSPAPLPPADPAPIVLGANPIENAPEAPSISNEADDIPTDPVAPQPALEVLTQLAPAPSDATPTQAAPLGKIAPEEIAQALQHFNCRRLAPQPDDECPKPDPFAVAEARQARAEERLNPMSVMAFNQQNAAERFFSKQGSNAHMFPGMDADLFADPLPAGAHDAARIRNGLAPSWERELRDALDNPAD